MPEEYYDEDGFRLSFENDTDPEEKQYYMRTFPNVSKIVERKIHCTSCQTHIGTAPMSVAIIRMHPVLRVTHCRSCHAFYNSGEFDKGEDGSELYCRWCGQGGEVYCCSNCPYVFCKSCILKNLSRSCVQDIARNENWNCFGCAPKIMWHLRAQHWALMNFIEKQKKDIKMQHDPQSIDLLLKQDLTTCCAGKGTPRAKGNQTPSGSGSKKHSKRPGEQDEAGNVPLAKIRNVGSGDSGMKKDKSLKPMVTIPPIPPTLLGREENASPSSTPTTKAQKRQKHNHPSKPVDSQEQSHSPSSPKKAKKGNNEVVCTPDIMSIFNQMDEARTMPATTSKQSNVSPGVIAIGAPNNIPDNLNAGPSSSKPMSPLQVSIGTQKPKAILHKSLPRNLMVRLGPAEATPSASIVQANQVAESAPPTLRVPAGTSSSRQFNISPVYTTFNGYRIDLHSAAQQGTFRLPNGKLIQVRKTSDAAASTVSSPQITPDVAYGAPEVAPAGANPHIMEQRANRTPLALNSQTNIPGLVIRPTASQVYTPLLQQPPPSTPTFPIVQPTLSYIPQQHQQQHQQMQHQLQQQSLQHVQPPSMQQQHLQQQQQQQNQQQQQQHQQQQQQQQEQQHQQQQQQQEQQQQQPRQQLQQHIIQRQRSRPAQRSKSHKQPQRQQQLFQRILPYPQPPRPIPGIVSTGGQLATHAFAQRPNEEQMVQQSPHPPAASSPIQLPILHMLRGLVNAPHENTSLGSARKDFEEKLLGCVEACNHIIIKIHSLTQSNSFKSIRNTRDVKELFIHLSYLLTYGKGRFNTLHDRCVEDVKKMGFTKPSDFVMMGENVNNRNPEDSEDDDDCEIVEQNTTVIQVDSDDEGGAAEGSAAARRAKPPNDSTMPSNGGSNLPDSTSSGQQSMPNDSTVSSVLNKSAEERTDDSGMPSPAACSSKDSVADSRQTESAEPLQASTLDAEKQDKSNKESVENNPEDDRMEVSASNKQEVGLEKDTLEPAKENKTTEPMESLATEGESIAKSEETQPVANLEKETNEPAKETEASLEKETNVLAKENEIIDLMEPSDSEGESFTKSIEPQTEESSEKETNELAKEDDIIDLMEPSDSEGESITKSDEPTTEMKPTSDSEGESITKSDEPTTEASSEKETNDPAKANETTEPIESLESEGENQTKSDQTSTEAEKEALDPAKMNEITAPMESFDSEGGDHIKFHQTSSEVGLKTLTVASCISNDNTEKDASISKEELRNNSDVVVLKPTEQSTIPDGNDVSLGATLEPMEVSESQGEHPDNFNEVSLKDGMETHSTEDALGTGLDAELIEMSTTDRDQLDNVLSNTCLKKRVNEDSNTSTLGSWESIENLVEDVDGGHVKKCEAQTANTTEKCTISDEPTQPADVIPQEKNGDKIMVLEETMSEKVKEKNVKEDIQTKESTNTSPSSSKLIENENSNEEAGQDDFCKEDTDNSFHGGSNSPMVEGESNDKDLAVALDNSLNQSSILLNAISKTSETQEGSPEQNASINEEEQLSDKEKESDSAKDTTEDELEEVSKGGGSDCGVINLMDASNDTDLDEDRSEVDCFDVESKIPERDSQQAAIICLDDTVEQSVSGSSTAPKDSLHDILLDDLSSISSSSNDEYADAINKKDSTSHAKTIDAEAGQSTSSVVTDDKTSSASQAQTVSSSTLERPIEEPATIATDRALPSRTSFDQQREP